jgi:hypothetical protein
MATIKALVPSMEGMTPDPGMMSQPDAHDLQDLMVMHHLLYHHALAEIESILKLVQSVFKVSQALCHACLCSASHLARPTTLGFQQLT